MPRSSGKVFEEELKRSADRMSPVLHFHRLHDCPTWAMMGGGSGAPARFVPQQPYDALLFSPYTAVAMEMKVVSGAPRLAFARVSEHQRRGLLAFHYPPNRIGGVLVKFAGAPGKPVYWIPIDIWEALREKLNRKSITEVMAARWGVRLFAMDPASPRHTRVYYAVGTFLAHAHQEYLGPYAEAKLAAISNATTDKELGG